ncbi:hypothetical protein EXU85_26765 [Spirosoma sp. KCTC 42546]|uniref:hypothetical protein n=1 Tax=Spirosoma sp. KCTC 42546 TaxID=2520506 RepID=UPI00115B4183|nr:hypothetical protein [Spirosoma sp. KCTC 42546]QDK82013.1 hypothetical protein EXU85_26765 [Spirosoma sp. KCTC 42546]
MLETKQLKDFLEDQSNLIVDLNISLGNMRRLMIEKYDFEDQIKKYGFFKHHIYQLKFISIIQLSKLFSSKKNEERSFYKLCNKLETSEYGLTLRSLMEDNKNKLTEEVKSKSDIVSLVAEVRILINTHKELISRVVSLRDQVYAHIDNSPRTQSVSLDEMKVLVELANKIHNLIRFRIFFWQTMFDHVRDWSIDPILWQMSELKKIDLEELRKKKGFISE